MALPPVNEARQRQRTLLKNVSWNALSKAFYLVSRFFLPPLILAYVSLEEYGIWATCFILISYLGTSTFGVANVYVRYTAHYHARQEMENINRLISTGLAVTVSLSLIALTALWFLLPWLVVVFHIPAHLHRTASMLIFGTAATFLLDLTFGAMAHVLHGLQKIAEQTVIWVVGFCLETVLIVVFLYAGKGIYSLLWAFMIRYVVATIACVWWCYQVMPELSIGPRHFDRGALKLFYGYGAVVQVTGILSVFLNSIEKVIAGMFVGVGATGLMDVGEKLPTMVASIPATINEALLPALSQLHTLELKQEMARTYLIGARYLNVMTGFFMGFLAAFAAPILTAWMKAGDRLAIAPLIMAIFSLPYQMNLLTGPGSAFHRGAGKPLREMVYPLAQLVSVVGLVAVGFAWQGKTVLVISVAVAAGMVLSAVCYLLYTNRMLEVPVGAFVGRVLWPGLVPYLFGYMLFGATLPLWHWAGNERIRLLPLLILTGLGYCGIVGWVMFRFVFDSEEQTFIKSKLARFGRRAQP
ncbi:MAG: hypothetical protein K1Y36_04070 [Blastocatellia bacterium]|nr:hypothetical protein [Blastocatellia bacterium]